MLKPELDLKSLAVPPREVHVRRGYRLSLLPGLLGLAVAIGVVVGPLTWFFGKNLAKLQALKAGGAFAQARLVDAEVYRKQLTRGISAKAARLQYEFEVEGRAFRAEKEYLQGESPDKTATVLYLPSDPTIHLVRGNPISDDEIQRERSWAWGPLKMGLVIFALVGVSFGVVPCLFDVRRQIALARHGLAAEAVITRVSRDRLGRCVCHYEFQTPEGAAVAGKTILALQKATRLGLEVGQWMTVLFDSHRPRRNSPCVAMDAIADIARLPAPRAC